MTLVPGTLQKKCCEQFYKKPGRLRRKTWMDVRIDSQRNRTEELSYELLLIPMILLQKTDVTVSLTTVNRIICSAKHLKILKMKIIHL